MNDEIDPEIEKINRIWRLSYGELKQRCEKLEEELASARKFIYELGEASAGGMSGYERMRLALYSISTLESNTPLKDVRGSVASLWREGATVAFRHAAGIAKEALAAVDRLEEEEG